MSKSYYNPTVDEVGGRFFSIVYSPAGRVVYRSSSAAYSYWRAIEQGVEWLEMRNLGDSYIVLD